MVAIAIPIFTNALEKARVAVHEANVRSVKSAAVYKILNDEKTMAAKGDVGWVVSAKVTRDGEISNMTFDKTGDASLVDAVATSNSAPAWRDSTWIPISKKDEIGRFSVPDAGYWVRVLVHDTDLST